MEKTPFFAPLLMTITLKDYGINRKDMAISGFL